MLNLSSKLFPPASARRAPRRAMAAALALILCLGMLPLSALAAEEDCSHRHDETCGFVEGVAGSPCLHAHDEICGGLAQEPNDPQVEGAELQMQDVQKMGASVLEQTQAPVFDEGFEVRCDYIGDGDVSFTHQQSYNGTRTYTLYTAATGDGKLNGVTATASSDPNEFDISGIGNRVELWVSVTEEGKAESARTKITAMPNFPDANGSDLKLENPQKLADYLNYCEPGSASISGNTVTMSKNAAVLHSLALGKTDSFSFEGILNMNDKVLHKGTDERNTYVFRLQGAQSSFTLRGGKLYHPIYCVGGTLTLENCLLQCQESGVYSKGNLVLSDTTIEIVDNGQEEDEYFDPTESCALQMEGEGTLTMHTATLKNAFSDGYTYIGPNPLADCIAAESVSTPADSSDYAGDNAFLAGTQVCQVTVTVTLLDPDAYQPINGGLTVENDNIYANGNAITIVAGTAAEKTNIYYTGDAKKALIALPGMGAASAAGYDLSEYSIFGGGKSKDLENTSITMTGGKVLDIRGGCDRYNVSGTVNIEISGGSPGQVYAAGSGHDDIGCVNNAVITVTGGTMEVVGCCGSQLETVTTGAVTIKGDAQVGAVCFSEEMQSQSLTVGGNAKIRALYLKTEQDATGIASFAIDPDLGANASIQLYFFEPLAEGRVIATGAVAGDMGKISMEPMAEGYIGSYRFYLHGTTIKAEPLPTYAVGGKVIGSDGAAVAGAKVTLMRGNIPFSKAVTTASDGTYSFEKVSTGVFNVVASKDGQTVTRLITVKDANLTGQNLTMPTGNKNSILEVTGDDTPAAVVGGLDKIAADTALGMSNSITIKLIVERKAEETAPNAAAIKTLAGDQILSDFLDFTLNKVVTGDGAGTESINDTGTNILEIAIPYSFSGKKDVTVYRYHNAAEKLTALSARPGEDAMVDKTFYADAEGGFLYIYAAKFSTYAVAYTPEAGSVDPPTSSGGDREDSATHTIVATAGKGGSISPTGSSSVDHNGKKTFTITPSAGYEIADVLVDGKSVGAVASYTFEKVTAKHTIEASFRAVSAMPFTDVSQGDWFYKSVKYVYEKGIMSGSASDKFSPYQNTSRGMIVTILWRMEREPAAKNASTFADVLAGNYDTAAIAWGAENSVINGYGNGNFGPNDAITREQLVSILYRYAQHKGQGTPAEGMAMGNFSDNDQVSAYAREAMRWALGRGIIGGKGNDTLDPQGQATRAETAAVLERFLNQSK